MLRAAASCSNCSDLGPACSVTWNRRSLAVGCAAVPDLPPLKLTRFTLPLREAGALYT
jgi:hypothetical protein